MSVHISDSLIFKNAWATPELRVCFEDREVVKGWIEVMVALVETQAEFGLLPMAASKQLSGVASWLIFDAEFWTEVCHGYESSNHSLLGLIKALQRRSPDQSGEWWCYGATVQDITDTQTARILQKVQAILADRLESLIDILFELAQRHKLTPMCGRTHGQPGLPITFGFKVAGWLDEMLRHRQRLSETGQRLGVGQLGGGVGSLSSLGPSALELQLCFMKKLGLSAPTISWTVSRDRLAEWLNLSALISASCDRIGHEIYNLQRPEIGEVSEGFVSGTVGSITMPQKRNPEISEHLGTLARTVRYHAAQMTENLVHDHERDGRSWKAEWAILPSACLATDKALSLLQVLLVNLQVHERRMQENLASTNGFLQAEAVMLALTATIGKQSAHTLVYEIAMQAVEQGLPFKQAIMAEQRIFKHLTRETIDELFDIHNSCGCCAQMVDRMLAAVNEWRAKAITKSGVRL